MIDARDINCGEGRAHAFDPPLETVGAHAFPVVKRIAPELPGAAEVIGRHTCDDDGRAIFVELKLFRVGPNVGRVLGHEDRQIADDFDAVIVSVTLQREPLAKEEKLVKHVRFNFFSQLFARAFDGRWRAANKPLFPFVPRHTAMRIFESAKERIVFEPVGLLLRKSFEGAAQGSAGCLRVTNVRSAQELVLQLVRGAEINLLSNHGRRRSGVEQSFLHQHVRADKQRITGES